jgi:hypothetical protein
MPTATYTPLATVTLASTSGSITFSSIPGTYRDLILVIDGNTSGTGVPVGLRFNADSGTNYAGVIMSGSGSAAASSSNSANNVADIAYFDNTSKMNAITQIMDYSATDKHKTLLSRSNQAGTYVLAYASRWANTSAITSIQVLPLVSSLAAGTTLSLYGVIA